MGDTGRFDPRAALSQMAPAAIPPAATAPADKPEPKEIPYARIVRLGSWFALMAMSVVAIIPMLVLSWQEVETWSLANAEPADARAALTRDWSQSSSPDYLEVVSELSLKAPSVDEASAWLAAKRATELDPSRAFAWANLAYLEARHAGAVNQLSLDALAKSMDACPLCDQELIRWRFNFVLSNWDKMPEELRKRAFEHADLLRWIGPNAEFLAEMRVKARLNGVPFDAYRSAVNTPARTWDIIPGTSLRGAGKSPA